MPNKLDVQGSGTLDPNTFQSTETILAHGQVKESIAKIVVIGVVLIILTLGGVAAYIWQPDKAKDFWLIIGPIVSASLGYLAGRREESRKR